MDIKPLVDDLNRLILEGKIMEAFEKYYADDVVMQENESEPRIGKETNRAYELAFTEGLVAFHQGEIKGVAHGDDISMVEWFMDMEHKEWGRSARTQVAIQRWKDGKIVHEKFYYQA